MKVYECGTYCYSPVREREVEYIFTERGNYIIHFKDGKEIYGSSVGGFASVLGYRSFYELSFSQRRKLEMSKERNKNVWGELN